MGGASIAASFLGYSTVISVLQKNWMGVSCSVGIFFFYYFLFALSVDFIT